MEQELWILLRLVIAAGLGGVIGYERERTGKDAGLRTHILIAYGAAMFVSFVELIARQTQDLAPAPPPGNFRIQIDTVSIVQAVVTGIAFLGAGTIFVSGRSRRVKGLTTAAAMLVTAAVGIAVGLQAYVLAAGATLLTVLVLHFLPSGPVPAEE